MFFFSFLLFFSSFLSFLHSLLFFENIRYNLTINLHILSSPSLLSSSFSTSFLNNYFLSSFQQTKNSLNFFFNFNLNFVNDNLLEEYERRIRLSKNFLEEKNIEEKNSNNNNKDKEKEKEKKITSLNQNEIEDYLKYLQDSLQNNNKESFTSPSSSSSPSRSSSFVVGIFPNFP